MTDATRVENVITNPRRTFVIADIHGDYEGYRSVLLQMWMSGMNLQVDLLVQLGDMIDGFTKSFFVVSSLRSLQLIYPKNVVILKGNHEDMLLNAIGKHEGQSNFRTWWYQGGQATYESYYPHTTQDDYPFIMNYTHNDAAHPLEPFQPTGILKNDADWFAQLPLYFESDQYIFVHAGLREPLPPEAQKPRDMLWIREEFHESTYDWGKPVVYGHTAREEPLIESNKIGLDTRWRSKGSVGGAELKRNGQHIVYRG